MTVREFAAFTGMSKAQVRAEIRAKRLMARTQEAEKIDGKTVPEHYEITEDPAQWLKKRNTVQTPEKTQETETESLPSRQKSQQEQEQQKVPTVLIVLGLSLVAAGTIGALLWREFNRSY